MDDPSCDELELEDPAPPLDAAPVAFEPGVRDDLSHADYLRIPAFSASMAKRLLATSPMHAEYDRLFPPPERRATAVGTATHMAILEPHRLETDVAIIPDHAPKRPTVAQLNAEKTSRQARESMAWWADWAEYVVGKCVVTATEFSRIEGMARAVRRHPHAADLLAEGRAEVTLQWLDARMQIPCKARLDWQTPDHWIVDVKTARDASERGFYLASRTYGYHFQEAHYRTGYEHVLDRSPAGFLFIAVEPLPPHGCAVYVMPSNAVHFALDEVERAMLLYAQATRTNYWRGYPERVISVPFSRFDLQRRMPEDNVPRALTRRFQLDSDPVPAEDPFHEQTPAAEPFPF